MIRDITAYNQKYDISYQLGAYYDMRYSEYFTRFKFLLGLSKYNEDDTVSVREEELIMQPFQKYDQVDKANYWNYWELQERRNKCEIDSSHTTTSSPVLHLLKEMATHIQKEDPFDKVVNELLFTYPDLDEQEFQVLRTVVWVMWDLSSGRNWAYYDAIVEYLLDPHFGNRRDLFLTIKDAEDTIHRLISKGILFQHMDKINICDVNRNLVKTLDEPCITLSFTNDPEEVIRAIGETFSQELHSFFGPHTKYDVRKEFLD